MRGQDFDKSTLMRSKVACEKVLKVVKVARPEPQVRLDDCLDAANDDDELALKDDCACHVL